jgi:hypothetical protein
LRGSPFRAVVRIEAESRADKAAGALGAEHHAICAMKERMPAPPVGTPVEIISAPSALIRSRIGTAADTASGDSNPLNRATGR